MRLPASSPRGSLSGGLPTRSAQAARRRKWPEAQRCVLIRGDPRNADEKAKLGAYAYRARSGLDAKEGAAATTLRAGSGSRSVRDVDSNNAPSAVTAPAAANTAG